MEEWTFDVVESQRDDDFKALMDVLQRRETDEVTEANHEMPALIKSLGGDSSRYRRERARALEAVVSHIYFPHVSLRHANSYQI